MLICGLFPNTLDYFILDEKPAEDVIHLICQLAKREESAEKAHRAETKRKVYADQANWY